MANPEFKAKEGRSLVGVSNGGKELSPRACILRLNYQLRRGRQRMHDTGMFGAGWPAQYIPTYQSSRVLELLDDYKEMETGLLELAWINGDIESVNRILGRTN